jgi:hypothetical protein
MSCKSTPTLVALRHLQIVAIGRSDNYCLFARAVEAQLMPAPFLSPHLLPILLLLGSNIFMTTAWYWHLRFKEVPLWQVILLSWSLAFSNIV